MAQCVPCLGYKCDNLGMDRQTPYKADAAESSVLVWREN